MDNWKPKDARERAYIEGRNAARDGLNKYLSNPYGVSDLSFDWYQGYEDYEEELYEALEDSPELPI